MSLYFWLKGTMFYLFILANRSADINTPSRFHQLLQHPYDVIVSAINLSGLNHRHTVQIVHAGEFLNIRPL